MRTKVISILSVVALFLFIFMWGLINLPIKDEATGLPVLAYIIVLVFAMFGMVFLLERIIIWLLNPKKAQDES